MEISSSGSYKKRERGLDAAISAIKKGRKAEQRIASYTIMDGPRPRKPKTGRSYKGGGYPKGRSWASYDSAKMRGRSLCADYGDRRYIGKGGRHVNFMCVKRAPAWSHYAKIGKGPKARAARARW